MAGCSVGAAMRQFQKKYFHTKRLFFQFFFGLSKKARNSFDYSDLMLGDASGPAALPPSRWTGTSLPPILESLENSMESARGRQPGPKSTDFHASSRINSVQKFRARRVFSPTFLAFSAPGSLQVNRYVSAWPRRKRWRSICRGPAASDVAPGRQLPLTT